MAIKELKKSVIKTSLHTEKNIESFISKGGTLAQPIEQDGDHRLTVRIPKKLMVKIDIKRKERIGKISRNLWILELIEKATR